MPRSEGGVDLGRLAPSAHRAYQYGYDGNLENLPDLGFLPDEVRDGWFAVSAAAVAMAQDAFAGDAAMVANILHATWYKSVHGREAPVNSVGLPIDERVAWEVVGRHLAYILAEADENEDLAGLESSWRAWAVERKNKILGVVHEPAGNAEDGETEGVPDAGGGEGDDGDVVPGRMPDFGPTPGFSDPSRNGDGKSKHSGPPAAGLHSPGRMPACDRPQSQANRAEGPRDVGLHGHPQAYAGAGESGVETGDGSGGGQNAQGQGRRVKELRLDGNLLVDFLAGLDSGMLWVQRGIPADAKVVGIKVDGYHTICILLDSDHFQPLNRGSSPPQLKFEMTGTEVSVHKKDLS